MARPKRSRNEMDPWAEASVHLKSADPKLAVLIEKVGPCRLRPAEDLLATLVESIVSQQISAKAARTIFGKVDEVMSSPWRIDDIDRLNGDFLKACGVSPQKMGYLASLFEYVRSEKLYLGGLVDKDEATVVAELTQVRGIGRWTAEMFLIFALNRPDVLPMADLGIRTGLKRIFELEDFPSPEVSEELTRSWRPYRSVASWYLWRMFD